MASETVLIHITRVREGYEDLALPAYETPGAAGMDLRAALEGDLTLEAHGGFARIPTGLAIALPEGHEAQVRPRSGLAAKHAVTVLNAPGTIDADYRGEIQVLLINHGLAPYTVKRGERIAQLVIAPVARAAWSLAKSLPESERGGGGFGSTGT